MLFRYCVYYSEAFHVAGQVGAGDRVRNQGETQFALWKGAQSTAPIYIGVCGRPVDDGAPTVVPVGFV